MPSSMRWWVFIKSLSRWSLTYGLLLFTRKKGVTLRSALVLPVLWKWFGTGLSAPLSISPACCKVRVPIFDPDWPPYCRGFFLDSRTYRQDFVLQLIWSSILMTLPELWILTSLITCLGLDCWILIQKSDFEIWVKQRARTKYAVWGPGISCDPEWAAPLYIHQWSDCTQHARVDLYLALFSMLCACTCRTRIRACGARVYIYSGQGIRPYRAPLCILSPLGGPSMCGICWKQ